MARYNLQGVPLQFWEQEMVYLTCCFCQRELLSFYAILPDTFHSPQIHRCLRAGRIFRSYPPPTHPTTGVNNLLKRIPSNHSSLLEYFWNRTHCFPRQPISHPAVNLHMVGPPSMSFGENDLEQHPLLTPVLCRYLFPADSCSPL